MIRAGKLNLVDLAVNLNYEFLRDQKDRVKLEHKEKLLKKPLKSIFLFQ
jgi:hypothetical protein